MSQELKCLKNSDTKAYIIPTNEWLQPIESLITGSSNAKIISAKLLDKEKILVRLTANNNKRLPLINSKYPNEFFLCIIRNLILLFSLHKFLYSKLEFFLNLRDGYRFKLIY